MKSWARDLALSLSTMTVMCLLLVAVEALLHLPIANIRGEVWVMLCGLISGLILSGRVARRAVAVAGITAVPVIGLALSFASTGRRFPDSGVAGNLVGLAYIGLLTAVAAAAGLGLIPVLRRLFRSGARHTP